MIEALPLCHLRPSKTDCPNSTLLPSMPKAPFAAMACVSHFQVDGIPIPEIASEEGEEDLNVESEDEEDAEPVSVIERMTASSF